jgi:hypothetical protein
MMMRYHHGLGIGHTYLRSSSSALPNTKEHVDLDDPLPDLAEESGRNSDGSDDDCEEDDLEDGDLEHIDDDEFAAFEEMYGTQ